MLLPIDWMMRVIVPATGSASAIVSGIRSAPAEPDDDELARLRDRRSGRLDDETRDVR